MGHKLGELASRFGGPNKEKAAEVRNPGGA
jgi:hypothetical protein